MVDFETDMVDDGEQGECGATLDEHIADIWVGLRVVGVGTSCETAYQALVEFVEAVRVANNHPVYMPNKPNGYVNNVIGKAIARAVERHQPMRRHRVALDQLGVKRRHAFALQSAAHVFPDIGRDRRHGGIRRVGDRDARRRSGFLAISIALFRGRGG